MAKKLCARLHPRLAKWIFANYRDFTDAQLRCVPSILKRESILLTSPTGSGKTLAGFLGVFDFLLRKLDAGTLTHASLDRVQSYRWTPRELEVISPFSFGIYASKIKESMMLEDPGAALERIYADLYARVESVAERK
jgi:DEAD/DEAH box helicase